MKRLLLIGLFVASVAGAIETKDFSRYQAIIKRSPFGGQDLPDRPRWSEAWQFVGVFVSNSGTGPVQAILLNKETNRWFSRAEGEVVDSDVTLTKIDTTMRPPTVVLKNGIETVSLSFPEHRALASASGTAGANANPVAGSEPRRIPFRRGN